MKQLEPTPRSIDASRRRYESDQFEADLETPGIRILTCHGKGTPTGKAIRALKTLCKLYESDKPRRARKVAVDLNRIILEMQ